jgi:hypothetical protein
MLNFGTVICKMSNGFTVTTNAKCTVHIQFKKNKGAKMKTFINCFLLFLIFFFVGCAQKLPEGMSKPYPVTITVMMDGLPLEGAMVYAYPTNSEMSQWAGAGSKPTNSSGTTNIYTYLVKGLVAGEYIITVEKQTIEQHPEDSSGNSDLYELFVATEFWKKETSPLKINVSPKGNNHFTVEVKKFDPNTYDQKKYRKRLKK